MPVFEFTITAPATMSARVKVEADSIEDAHAKAVTRDFRENPDNKVKFELDDGNDVRGVYIPDENEYEVSDAPKP